MIRYHKTVVLLLALCAMTTTPVDAQEPQSYSACFVPQVGAMYLLDLPGLPTSCLSEGHEEITWSEGGPLPDSSVTSAMIATEAVDSTHIAPGAVSASELNVRFERISRLFNVPSNTTTQLTIACSQGREVLSGGVSLLGDAVIRASYPSSESSWVISLFNPSITGPMRFYALCADLS